VRVPERYNFHAIISGHKVASACDFAWGTILYAICGAHFPIGTKDLMRFEAPKFDPVVACERCLRAGVLSGA
jgi:hypothetical protein